MANMQIHDAKPIPTIFHDILTSDLAEEEKTLDRLWQEGQTFVAAGTETTAWCLAVITFYLLQSPEKLQRLREELLKADVSSSIELEKLPYLSAVIQEGLRLSYGVCARLPRIAPSDVLQLKDGDKVWDIPTNVSGTIIPENLPDPHPLTECQTPISMSAGIMHIDPRIFPNPLEFQPDRWLNNKGLDRYLVSFSKGSRQCVGINLAYSELYICLNAVFTRYAAPGLDSPAKISLFGTTKGDVELKHDLFIPGPNLDSKGIRVIFDK
jgi:cytochrome P450